MSPLAAALAPVHQKYLLQARQMQALSFTVHIPLVAFGIAFPVMVRFVEWLHMRTGDPVYWTLARRWTRLIVALFAVGVITGTILSLEMGLLWRVLFPSLGLLFSLTLRGRYDPHAEPHPRPTPAQLLRASTGTRFGARLAVALLIAGVGLLNAASAPWAHAIGVLSLFGFMITAFLEIAPRALAEDS